MGNSGNDACIRPTQSDGYGRLLATDDGSLQSCASQEDPGKPDQKKCKQPFESCVHYEGPDASTEVFSEVAKGFYCAAACEAPPVNAGPIKWARPKHETSENWQWATSMSSTSGSTYCTSERAHTDGGALIISWEVFSVADAVFTILGGIFMIVEDTTNQAVIALGFGGNVSAAGAPVAAVAVVGQAIAQVAKAVIDGLIRCNVRIQSMETQAIYDRTDYLQASAELARMQVVMLGETAGALAQQIKTANDNLIKEVASDGSNMADILSDDYPSICKLAKEQLVLEFAANSEALGRKSDDTKTSYWKAILAGGTEKGICACTTKSSDCGDSCDSSTPTPCQNGSTCTEVTSGPLPNLYCPEGTPSIWSDDQPKDWPVCHKVGVIRACASVFAEITRKRG